MHPTIRAAIMSTLVAATAPAASRAADLTPDQARVLEGQLRDWFASMAGPDIPVAKSPIQVAPDGDHYRLTVPFTTGDAGKSSFVFMGNARPIDPAAAGAWTGCA